MTAPMDLLPPAPTRADPDNFSKRGDDLMTALPAMVEQFNARLPIVDAAVAAGAIATAAALAAQAAADATAWVSGSTYAYPECAISPTSFQTYRKKTASSVTNTDPANDPDNWAPVSSARRNVIPVNAARTITAADLGKQLICSGTFTLSYDPVASLGDGFYCHVKVVNGVVTHDPSGTQTIDSLATLAQPAGQSLVVIASAAALEVVRTSTRTTVVLTATQSWSPPYPCIADIYVTGGGGKGGDRLLTYDGSLPGGTAGTAIKFGVMLSPSVVYTATVGGAATASQTAGTASSFSGAGLSAITGNGGPAGARIAEATLLNALFQTSGGTASGGDMNISGEPGYVTFFAPAGTVGANISTGHAWAVMPLCSGASFWGAGAAVGFNAVNYGTGSCGSGTASAFSLSAKSGVIVIQYQGI